MIRRTRTLLLSLLALAACEQSPGRVGPGETVLVLDVDPEPIDQLDILFVIDNSGSMLFQQMALVEAARASLFGQLADELGHLPDLHVGVTSTSVGISTLDSGGDPCRLDSPFGHGGRLTIYDSETGTACPGIDGLYLIDEDDGAGGRTRNYTGDLADAFGCIANLGTGGCGFEHPLEAMARAVDGTYPENAGFLRDDALLLVVFVADEDDCSASDPAMFEQPSAPIGSPLGPHHSFRCFEFGVACAEEPRPYGAKTDCVPRDDSPYLTPIDTLVARLRAAKDDPSRIMVAGLHGGPEGVMVGDEPNGNPGVPSLLPLCLGTDFEVTPAVRLTAFEQSFPARWILAPACLETASAKVARITRATAGILDRSTCLLGPTPDAGACEVATVSPAGVRTAIPRCGAGGGTDCYQLVADAARCGYTDHQLDLVVPPAMVPAGDRLQMRCGLAR